MASVLVQFSLLRKLSNSLYKVCNHPFVQYFFFFLIFVFESTLNLDLVKMIIQLAFPLLIAMLEYYICIHELQLLLFCGKWAELREGRCVCRRKFAHSNSPYSQFICHFACELLFASTRRYFRLISTSVASRLPGLGS